MSSWLMDKTFAERERIVRAKANELGISQYDAYKLCTVEYETGHKLDEVTPQTDNAYNQYMLVGTRPNTQSDDEMKRKMAYELKLSTAQAWQREEILKMKAAQSVDERMIADVGLQEWEKSQRSVEEYKNAIGYFGINEKMPSISMPKMSGFDIGGLKKSLQVTGLVVMGFLALLIYLIFVRGKGAEGVSVSAVGK